ncbi:hypothetical protein [Chryseobacterium sp.]|uniref:hypothetical protein n=1 Tax=Chryseobacterium sp. TaxID=1871047 RepID=UPI003219BA13
MKQPIKATIQIDETIKIKRLNNVYNQTGFICQALIPLVDQLIETTTPKFALKRAVNELLRETEKMSYEHYSNFENYGKVHSTEGEHESLDIYQLTSKAYDSAVQFFIERSPNEIVSIMELIRRLEKDGVNLSDIAVDYQPMEK